MINALTQSPFVARKIYEWKEQLEKNQLLVRDIIDIDSTYEDFESINNEETEEEGEKITKESKLKKTKDAKEEDKKSETNNSEEDEFNLSLAKMEEEIRPKIVNIIDVLTKNYKNLKNTK